MGQEDHSSLTLSTQSNRWSIFLQKWEQALKEDRECLVLGDVNLDFLEWNKQNLPPNDSSHKLRPLKDNLFATILPYGVTQLVKKPTRVSPSGIESGLDHVYTNKPDKCLDVEVLTNGASDHKIVKITRFTKAEIRCPKYITKRSYKHFNEQTFMEDLSELNWYEIHASEDANDATKILKDNITKVLDKHAPIKTFQVRKNYALWLSEESKDLIKERDRALDTANRTGDANDRIRYKNLRNSLTSRMRKEKRRWEEDKLDCAKNDSSAIWKNVKSWISWGNKGSPSKVIENGKLISSPKELSEAMNKFFISKETEPKVYSWP